MAGDRGVGGGVTSETLAIGPAQHAPGAGRFCTIHSDDSDCYVLHYTLPFL